jgi:hypothetical protein
VSSRNNIGPAGFRRAWEQGHAIAATQPERAAQLIRIAELRCPDVATRCAKCGQQHNGTGPLSKTCAARAARKAA